MKSYISSYAEQTAESTAIKSLELVKAIGVYLAYVMKHKWYVFKRGRQIGVPLWQLVIHDLSKLSPLEFKLNIQRIMGINPEQNKKLSNFYHHRRNPHHWAYWATFKDVMEMPERFIREMLADWQAAGEAKGGMPAWEWWEKKRHLFTLHPRTEKRIEELLQICKERWMA